nr:TadE/TadG family type IV pilus assembly protein [Falsiroseomonas bella]
MRNFVPGERAGRCAGPQARPGRRRGSAAAEFGLLLPAFLMAAIGVVEVGWQLAVASTLDRATAKASRFGITGQQTRAGAPAEIACRSQAIPWIIADAGGRILSPERLQVTTGAHAAASAMNTPPTAGAGRGGQVVTYSVTYTEPFMSGVWLRLLGGPEHLVHRATIVVKNEAFDNATC